MRKRKAAFILAAMLLLTIALAGCNTPSAKNENSGIETSAGNGKTSAEKNAQELLHAIVFDDKNDDNMSAKAPGMSGSSSLKLTLYETAPGVYAGDGIMERTMISEYAPNTTSYHTAFRISFDAIQPGQTVKCTAVAMHTYDESSAWGSNPALGIYKPRVRYTQQMPLEYRLDIDGSTAQLVSVRSNGETPFHGVLVLTEAPPAKPDLGPLSGRCISVNSVFSEYDKSYNHEYRAMLTAAQTTGNAYAGDLCVYGEAKDIPFVDQAITFTLQPFDAKAYRDAGGSLPGGFDAFGVINAAAGRYIVLLYGEIPLMEAANSEKVFYGSLTAQGEMGEAKREMDETKQLMRTFYDNPDKEKLNPAGMTDPAGLDWVGKPPWYPDWLMPNMSSPDGWRWRKMLNAQGFNKYIVQYTNYAPIDQVIESYKNQGYENFEIFDLGGAHGVQVAMYFTKGAYSFMVLAELQTSSSTGMIVYIT
jgi:hypothetical protein